ncbi:DUF1033 family protein [Planococcus glaciei]|nr:DUF1033 family protein [Planococcus glaciei]
MIRRALTSFRKLSPISKKEKKAWTKNSPAANPKGREPLHFWNEGDLAFCEECEENLQIYHGLLWTHNKKPINSF